MHFLLLSKVPVNEPPPGFPVWPLWREVPVYRNKEIFSFSQRPQERSIPPCFPKAGPLWKQAPISTDLLSIFFGVPSKGTLPPGSPHRAPLERNAPLLEPSFIHLSKSTVYQPPSRFPSRTPKERDACLQSLFYITFIRLSKSPVHDPPSRFPNRAPMGRDACHQSLPLYNLQGLQ